MKTLTTLFVAIFILIAQATAYAVDIWQIKLDNSSVIYIAYGDLRLARNTLIINQLENGHKVERSLDITKSSMEISSDENNIGLFLQAVGTGSGISTICLLATVLDDETLDKIAMFYAVKEPLLINIDRVKKWITLHGMSENDLHTMILDPLTKLTDKIFSGTLNKDNASPDEKKFIEMIGMMIDPQIFR